MAVGGGRVDRRKTTPGATPAPAAAQTCQQAMDTNWKATVEALANKHFAEANTSAVKLAAMCEDNPVIRTGLATFTAEIALETGKPQNAIAMLDLAPPAETSRLWINSRFIYLAAFKALNEDARFRAERDHLVVANEVRMLAGDYWMKQERFETPLAVIDVYRRRNKPDEPNDTLFIATPRAADMPLSYEVNEGGLAGLMGALTGKPHERDEIGDLNKCEMHASLGPTKANYVAWRAKAVELFSDPKVVENKPATGANLCPSWTFILPGLVPADDGQ